MVKYFLRISGEETFLVEKPSWRGYSFYKEKNITEKIKSGELDLEKIGEPIDYERTWAPSIREIGKNLFSAVKTKKIRDYSGKEIDSEPNALALVGKINSKEIKEKGTRMKKYRAKFQFYGLTDKENILENYKIHI